MKTSKGVHARRGMKEQLCAQKVKEVLQRTISRIRSHDVEAILTQLAAFLSLLLSILIPGDVEAPENAESSLVFVRATK